MVCCLGNRCQRRKLMFGPSYHQPSLRYASRILKMDGPKPSRLLSVLILIFSSGLVNITDDPKSMSVTQCGGPQRVVHGGIRYGVFLLVISISNRKPNLIQLGILKPMDAL